MPLTPELSMRLSALLLVTLSMTQPSGSAQFQASHVTTVEEIYVGRSVRESRAAPGEFCAPSRTGFGRPRFEDRFTFRSVAARPENGRVVDADVKIIGRVQACFGSTDNPTVFTFYAEGDLAGITFTGSGECHSVKRDFPERGVQVQRCFLELRNLPAEYVGGHLTASTVMSRAPLGPTSDPPGYAQSSIATVRLWRHR